MSGSQSLDVSHSAASVPLPSSPALPTSPEVEGKQTITPTEPIAISEDKQVVNEKAVNSSSTVPKAVDNGETQYEDPLSLSQHKKPNVSQRQLKVEHPKANKKKLKKFYTRQNELIDKFLASGDEERLAILDMEENGPKIKIAIYGSSAVNFCLFVIQMYAAISTGSLSLFATAADAFVSKIA
jgi:hypothetical protein